MSNIQIIAKQFALQTRLFNNVLEGIENIHGGKRLSEEINHLQWIAGHLANIRHNYTSMIGLKETFPYKDKYSDPTQPPPGNRAIDASVQYPSLSEISASWNALASKFVDGVSQLNDEQVAAEFPFGTPIGDKSILGLFGFLASHESYHIGQMSLVRKYLGLEAMSYQ
jgi:hypothetical protein